MIENFGIGIDIVDISRFRNQPFEEKKTFYGKIFNEKEIKYCLQFNDPYPHFAGKFAVKEAVIKSIEKKIKLSEIETEIIDLKPKVKLTGKYSNEYYFKISISHEKYTAVGIVISEKII